MTPLPWLNLALVAVSLFNVVVLIWLGLTIALNAARPRWGIWMAGATVILAGLFFAAHGAIVSGGFDLLNANLGLWWPVGWLPVIALPFAWYGMTLWYSGYIAHNPSYGRVVGVPYLFVPKQRGEGAAFVLALGLTVLVFISFLGAIPLPVNAAQVPFITLLSPRWIYEGGVPATGGAPLFAYAYPANIVLCMLLSIYTLRQSAAPSLTADTPAQLDTIDAARARRRARPWLLTTALCLLAVSLLVAGAFAWVLANEPKSTLAAIYTRYTLEIGVFDLITATLIAAACVALGQGVVSYEVFSGNLLPRRELRRHWRNTVILAGGFAVLVGGALTVQVRAIFGVLAAAAVMAVFYALQNWRAAQLRDRHIALLTRLTGGAGGIDSLSDAGSPDADAPLGAALAVLCADVLGAQRAWLAPLGSLAPLLTEPLRFPANAPALSFDPAIVAPLAEPPPLFVPLDPRRHDGAHWAVPLRGPRGVTGVLLLGERLADDRLYTQEQLEVARANAERLLDSWAMRALAGRLMALQRQRIAESGVADRRMRRLIHDDVLPRVHAALLKTSDAEAIAALTAAHRDLAGLLRELPSAPAHTRGAIGALRDLVALELAHEFDAVHWSVDPAADACAAGLSPATAEVLFYAAREALRNAARYGRGGAARALTVQVSATLEQGDLVLSITDDGVGIAPHAPNVPGRGHGLTLHSTLLMVVGGGLTVSPAAGGGTLVQLMVPK